MNSENVNITAFCTLHTSASFPFAVENLLVCLNLENPKADVPFLVKNPFLKSEAWGFVFSYNWLLSTTQIVDGEKITCNLWRAIMFFLAIFDAVRISEALVQRKLHVLLNWLLWPKLKLRFTTVLVHLILGITTFGGFGGHIMLLGHPFCHGSSSTSGSLLQGQYFQQHTSGNSDMSILTLAQGCEGSKLLWHPQAGDMVQSEEAQSRRKI